MPHTQPENTLTSNKLRARAPNHILISPPGTIIAPAFLDASELPIALSAAAGKYFANKVKATSNFGKFISILPWKPFRSSNLQGTPPSSHSTLIQFGIRGLTQNFGL